MDKLSRALLGYKYPLQGGANFLYPEKNPYLSLGTVMAPVAAIASNHALSQIHQSSHNELISAGHFWAKKTCHTAG